MPRVAIARVALAAIFLTPTVNAGANVPEVPGDDIFGFTTPTDIGNPGDTGFGNENDGRAGKRSGSYRALSSKFEFGYTFAPDWWIGASLYAAHNFSRDVPDLANVNRIALDGLSFEIEHRIVKRTRTNPVAVAVSLEPRMATVDSVSGMPAYAINAAFKLFVDAVVVPDKLYWASNVIWTPQRAEDPMDRSRWLSSSAVLVSTAVAYQVSGTFFVGAEARYLGSHSAILPTREVGYAVFVGPTVLWKITDKVAFNTTLQPQVAGRSTANPALRLDLDNFEKLQFRAKLFIALQ